MGWIPLRLKTSTLELKSKKWAELVHLLRWW